MISSSDIGLDIRSDHVIDINDSIRSSPPQKQRKVYRDEQLTGSFIFVIVIGVEVYWSSMWLSMQLTHTLYLVGLCLVPILVFLSMFFVSIFVNSVFNILLPTRWVTQNSRYFSYHRSPLPNGYQLPLVTIQIPVYKENFHQVIKPTVECALKACRKYIVQGGSANLFINDDGLMAISSEQREERINYYASQPEICYVARPVADRAGRFKKASNMNFCLRFIHEAYDNNCQEISQVINNLCNKYHCLADINSRFIDPKYGIIGKYVIILDSDSRMAEDCFYPLVCEMESDLRLAYAQIITKPLRVIYNYWENAIAHFTDHIYNIAFVYSCSNGNPAPLVGHNAMLRWSVIDEVARIDSEGQPIYWAEDKVSEDFDMSLRMYSFGYSSRYIAYDLGFQEGVSLSVLEEINRFRKYAYGVNEMIIHPITEWTRLGLITPVFKQFVLGRDPPFYIKFNMLAYMGSYYALAMSPLMTLTNYFACAYSDYWNYIVINSYNVLLSCAITFSILMPLSNVVVRWKLGYHESWWKTITEEVFYTLVLSVFFSGLGYHILVSIIKHLFQLKIGWSTTQKDIVATSWRIEIGMTLKNLYVMYMWCLASIVLIFGMWFVPFESIQIRNQISIVPLVVCICGHMLMPIVLNPVLTGCNIKYNCYTK